jgi:LysM repeat protein
MFRKGFACWFVFALVMLGLFGAPAAVRAGGVCGGTYIVETGDTIEKLAAMCGTTVNAIYAANPGISANLYAGQVLTIPGADFGVPYTPPPVTNTPYSPVNYDPYYGYLPGYGSSTVYIVRFGDTFSEIARRFRVSVYALWVANPHIRNINLIYAGQVIYIPTGYPIVTPPAPHLEPVPLSYPGDVPRNASQGSVRLVNNANADVYISLRTTRADGTGAIHEFPVGGTLQVQIPTGWIDYVAWVGGVKFTGGFKLSESLARTITFNKSKVVVD